MTEQKVLPLIITDEPISLPGQVITVTQTSDRGRVALDKAQKEYNNQVVVLFKPAGGYAGTCIFDSVLPVGIIGEVQELVSTEDKVEATIKLVSRAVYVSKNDTADYRSATFDIEMPVLELDPISQQNYADITGLVKLGGADLLDHNTEISKLIKEKASADLVCDTIAMDLFKEPNLLQTYLLTDNLTARFQILAHKLAENIYVNTKLEKKLTEQLQKEIAKEQKEYILRKKIHLIQEELGDVDSNTDKLKEQIESSAMPGDIKEQVLKELKRYQSTTAASPESTMIRAYIDLMLALPWDKETVDTLDISKAKEKLDETHFGLDKVKDRILEYLGVKLYTGKNPQTILCLAGAPGVGKTTLARSVAEALGRKFVKQSMGGVKDEAEIRGHRRTYIGALPGRIINGIKEAGVVNPVFLLDEIDKIGSDYKGDPSNALLEVLDPAQNVHFMDHYTEVEYDLSKVMFICTANYLENIPAPLKDRMEIIELSSYTELEKFQIAKNYVIKKSLEKNGLEKEKFDITDDAIRYLIKYYTREAGARQLERCMDSLVRKAIKKILAKEAEVVHIEEAAITEMLGKKIYNFNEADKKDLAGVVNGLAYTQAGGDTLQIEVQLVKGKGEVKLTGKLGDVMKESAEVAYTWVKANAGKYGIDPKKFDEYNVHIHVPEGATPKDGPSAGVTMTTAILSAFAEKPVRHDLGMTGEATLRGRVLPIGGLKEKSIAAYRTGLKQILIPAENEKDLEDIPDEVKENLKITPVSTLEEVIDLAVVK